VRRILSLDGAVYALTDRGVWKNGSEQVLKPEQGALKDGNISALATDSKGSLWIGYFDRGLEILDRDGRRETEWEDDHLFCINRIVHDDGRGTTAVATSNGLVLFNGSAAGRRVVGQAQGLIANQVTDVAIRPDGTMIAATPAGISFLDGGSISSIYAFQGLVNNHVYTLALDGPSTFAGTLGGLSVLDGVQVKTSYTTSNSALKHNWITAIARQGRDYFVGTYGAGVLRFTSTGRWETFEDLRGSLEINPNAMAVTKRAVYAGTLDHGLAVYDVANGRWHFVTDGLPSKNVTAVEAAPDGMIHIGTDNGLLFVSEDLLQ
jgi:ligand-binding sensor domain-containing protein